jgi:uncharacterized membrane protein YidH (DUF202 family)
MSPSGPDGASPQRTRLAWRRTALSHTACALLLLRLAAGVGRLWLGALVAALTLTGWLAAMLIGQRRINAMTVPAVAGRALPLAASLAVGFALLGGVLVVLG